MGRRADIHSPEGAGHETVLVRKQAAGEDGRKSDVIYLDFPVLKKAYPGIIQGFSTRLGGVSEGDLASMNLSFDRGDMPERVVRNYERIAAAIGFPTSELVFTDQIHRTEIYQASARDCQGATLFPKKLRGIDALITNEPHVVLTAGYADCVPVLIVDRKDHCIGLAHSGWRGTVGQIAGKTVRAMASAYHADPADMTAVIGPSIGPECYEVGEELIPEFQKTFPEEAVKDFFFHTEDGKLHLDLWTAVKYALLHAGVPEAQIHVSGVCTCCSHELLFSHRYTKRKAGKPCGLPRPPGKTGIDFQPVSQSCVSFRRLSGTEIPK